MKLLLVLTTGLFCLSTNVVFGKCKYRVCVHKLYPNNFTIDQLILVNPVHCTHIVIARAQVNSNQEIYVKEDRSQEIQWVVDLKQSNPSMKTIFAVENDIFADFVHMYTTDSLRQKFITNIIRFVRAKKVEGVKIDVQPAEGGNKVKFTQLFKELLMAILAEAAASRMQRLLLSVGIPSDKTFLDKYYDVASISKYVDMVDLATYNFDSPMYAPIAEHHSPLFRKDPSSTKTIDFMARYVAGKGVRKDKINIGLSVVATRYLKSGGGYLRLPLLFPYTGACLDITGDNQRYNLEPEKGRLVDYFFMHNEYRRKYFHDDPDTIKAKVKYVKENGYGGVMLYSVRADDPFNACGHGQFPLFRAAYDECSIN